VPPAASAKVERNSRTAPFVVGIAFATLIFILFGLDLAHHWVPYRPNKTPSPFVKWFPLLVWLTALAATIGMPWLRKRLSRSWPRSLARIETGSIASFSKKSGTFYVLTVGYWFAVDGQRYGGVHAVRLGSESDAEAMLNSLKQAPAVVRYKSSDPTNSLLTPDRP
jgi:hypothetical protein